MQQAVHHDLHTTPVSHVNSHIIIESGATGGSLLFGVPLSIIIWLFGVLVTCATGTSLEWAPRRETRRTTS